MRAKHHPRPVPETLGRKNYGKCVFFWATFRTRGPAQKPSRRLVEGVRSAGDEVLVRVWNAAQRKWYKHQRVINWGDWIEQVSHLDAEAMGVK